MSASAAIADASLKSAARDLRGRRDADGLSFHFVQPASLVPPVSRGYPAGLFSYFAIHADRRNSLVPTQVFRSLLGPSHRKHAPSAGWVVDALVFDEIFVIA